MLQQLRRRLKHMHSSVLCILTQVFLSVCLLLPLCTYAFFTSHWPALLTFPIPFLHSLDLNKSCSFRSFFRVIDRFAFPRKLYNYCRK